MRPDSDGAYNFFYLNTVREFDQLQQGLTPAGLYSGRALLWQSLTLQGLTLAGLESYGAYKKIMSTPGYLIDTSRAFD